MRAQPPYTERTAKFFITYSGSGFWSDYGLGQLTWNGGNPLETSSWVKLPVEYGNPIFTATTAENLRGAGHASFLTDTDGNGYFCYHAYGYNYKYNKDTKKWQSANGKESKRAAYIEPYYIDYTAWNGVSYGVVRLGLDENGVAADMLNSVVTFATDGSYLTSPDLYALGRTFSITLNMVETGAEGFIIYKSTDGEVFEYLTTTVGEQYVDEDVTEGETYYYRAYAYREEEISPVSEIASCKAGTVSPYTESATADGKTVTVTVHAQDNYDAIRLYRSEDGKSYGTGIQEIENVKYGETITFTDTVIANGTYHYMATGINGGFEYFPARTVSVEVMHVAAPTLSLDTSKDTYFILNAVANDNYQGIKVYFSTDGEVFELLVDSATDIVSGNTYTYSHKALTVGTTYYYYAVGYDAVSESEPSVTVSEMYAYVPDPKVISLSAKCTGNEVVFSSAIKHDSILVLRSTNNSQFTYHDSIVGTTYTDRAVIAEKTYYYKFIGVINGVNSSRRAAEYTFSTKHDEVSYSWVLATCTEDGHSGYSICNYCEEYVREKVIYPATGHSYEETEKEIPATTESAGKSAVYTCSACGDSYGGEEIPKLEAEAPAGDATGDGVINILDVLRVLKAVVGMDVEVSTANADMSGDGMLDIADVLAILTLVLNK